MVLRFLVGLSVVALLALGGLQYHWIGQIAEAERQRLERGVAESAGDFAEDFSAELRNLANALQPRFFSAASDADLIAARFRDWTASAQDPRLVESVYLVYPSEVLRFNPATGVFEPGPGPHPFPRFAELAAGVGPGFARIDADLMVLPLNRRYQGPRGGRGPQPPGGDAGPRGDSSWILAELNHDVIVSQILPRLISLRFPDYEGRDYRVAVLASRGGAQPRTIFTAGGEWTGEDLQSPDYAVDLLFPPPVPQRRGRGGERGRGPDQRGPMVPVVTLAGQNWQLLVKHRAGSVETAVVEFRRRNLAISFGVLIVLGVSAVAILISGSRARRLGRLQMEFASGISHELRTPLAVIQSAAHNLESGVVQDREGIREYAAIVKGEARRLTEMVEQVMAYTETQSGGKRYDLAPVDAGDVAELAIQNMSSVLREANAIVYKDIEADLPPVLADAPALTRCLQNLLSNAAKYGRVDHSAYIEIQARHIPEPGSAGKVRLSVADRGAGVPERDVKHLFGAFYRGSNASTNTPGNGLGLHLVDRIMEAQNGSVTYERSAHGGAKFTLTLRAAASPA